MKKCSRCAGLKPLGAFHRQAASRDGRAPACKDCTKKYAKERYWRNPERRRAESKRYRDAHPEKRRQWQRAYNARHRQEISERFAAMGWRKRWAALHPEKRRANEAKRRAQRHRTQIERVDYESIYERDGGVCYLCNGVVTSRYMEFDHVVPLSRGGAHTEANIALVHAMCNRRKGVKSADAGRS
ncbi:MAG TPA: HNH endonuclease [Candidatus Limnocylindria bacterium]|nr:HNH endonuclease [Candidatus Limnocylindria bacterium]